jgi:hypothetical protein
MILFSFFLILDYYVIDTNFESDIFWILVYVLHEKGWRHLYLNNTPKLIDLLCQLEQTLSSKYPKLNSLFQEYVMQEEIL